MKLSALCTLNERPYSVLESVFDSLKGQAHDELVIVLDRTPVVLADFCMEWWAGDKRVVFETLGGEPGWKSPVKAWNAGFRKARGDVFYCFSSETVQKEGNIQRAKDILGDGQGWSPGDTLTICLHGKAECSCGPQGHEVNWGPGIPGNLLCDAAHPRPLGFTWAAPAWAVRQIGGYDETFANGFWHDDDDFFLRLWRTSLDFVFDDSISGIHQHHERPDLETQEGQAGIQRNMELMLARHGTLSPWAQMPKLEERREGRTTWRHL